MIEFVPKQWENTFFAWMRDIQALVHLPPACGGGTGFRPGTGRTASVFVARDEAGAQAARPMRITAGLRPASCRTRMSWTPGSAPHLWPFSTLGWPEQTPELQQILPDRRAGDGVRHYFLLGGPDDHDGAAFHGAMCRSGPCIYPRPGARRTRPENVQIQGQRDRSAEPDRCLWRRCVALLR